MTLKFLENCYIYSSKTGWKTPTSHTRSQLLLTQHYLRYYDTKQITYGWEQTSALFAEIDSPSPLNLVGHAFKQGIKIGVDHETTTEYIYVFYDIVEIIDTNTAVGTILT